MRPEKVIVGPAGEPHLVDFGSWSRAMRRLLGPEGAKPPADSRGYTPREQAEGESAPASDVYALGATVAFALTGEDPASRAEPARLPVSRRFRRVLQRMLAENAEQRYPDARAVLRALDEPAAASRLLDRRVAAAAGVALALATLLLSWRPAPRPAANATPAGQLAPGAATRAADDPSASAAQQPAPSPQRIARERPVAMDDALPAVRPRHGTLRVDVPRAFKYVATGFPGALSTGQTNASALESRPHEPLRAEPGYRSPEVLYGYLSLGDGPDPRISFALDERDHPTWVLWIDRNNDEDLADDGPPLTNQGSGVPFAADVSLFVDVSTRDSGMVRRPFKLWFWVNRLEQAPDGAPQHAARFYATCHYAGRVELGGEVFDAVAFEQRNHDGLIGEEDGIWIDLDRNGKFEPPAEHFLDGEEIRTGRETVRLGIERP